MQWIHGQMAITRDLEQAFTLSLNNANKIVLLSDTDDPRMDENTNINVVKGEVLLPPMEAYYAEVDGDKELYGSIYSSYLSMEDPPKQFIAILLTALHNGENIIFYYASDETDSIIGFLYQYIGDCYGLYSGTDQTDYMVDNRYLPVWMDNVYLYNYIGPYEYLAFYPKECPINEVLLGKLYINLHLQNYPIERGNRLIDALKGCGNPNMQIPLL